MRSADEIRALYQSRLAERSPILQQMRDVAEHYAGELVIPLPELDRSEKSSVPNLIHQGLEQISLRIASVLPQVACPPRNPNVKREVQQAELRRKALLGWWALNDLPLAHRRRARWFTGYGCAPVIITPDAKRGIPTWQPRDPLGTFPGHTNGPEDVAPLDTIFSVTRTVSWLRHNYPEQAVDLLRWSDERPDSKLTVLEYVDDEQRTVIAISEPSAEAAAISGFRGRGSRSASGWGGGQNAGSLVGTQLAVTLESTPNRAGIPLVVVPGRITLGRLMGQFDQMLGMMQMSAKLMALEVIAAEKGVFPDLYLIGRDGRQPKFISGPHDGRSGLVNIVQDGDIREVQTNPGYMTNQTVDRLERAQRLTGGIPAEFGGESTSNVRTGRRGDSVLSAAVDYPIQEAQEIFAKSLQEENKRAIAVSKAYFGSRKSSFYVDWKGARGSIEFKPNDIFTTDENIVSYSHAGSDLNGLVILTGQLVGMSAMSKRTAMEILPIIEDPEREHDRVQKEALEAALLAGVQQKINDGTIAPVDAAWLMTQLEQDKMELAEAIIALDKRVQDRQASTTGMVEPGSPEAMAGLATGTPAEMQAVQPTIGEPPEAQQNLASMLTSLRRPQMTLPAER